MNNKMGRFAGISEGKDLDDIHGDTVVAEITIQLRRNGCMSVAGSINDLIYANYLLDTARDTLASYHARKRLGDPINLIVPAHDTALVGTEEEKKLLKARDELSDAMSGG
jgi:glyoxylase-like metal-dependent hydrolase (beta-lactamase superfamily II)